MMREVLSVAFLAIVQGITEFLPVSSSGHLALAQNLLDMKDESLRLTVVLHAGTLLAILIVYLGELRRLLTSHGFPLLLRLLLATIPAGLAGLTIHYFDIDKLIFGRTLLIPVAGFIFTGWLLLFRMKRQSQKVVLEKVSWRQAIIIGLMQMLAIVPGVSRSGSTISTGLRLGLKREAAASFSFLLAIPVIAGASLVELSALFYAHGHGKEPVYSLYTLLVGFIVSAIIGFAALNTLLESVRKGDFRRYAWYCFAVSGLALTIEIWSWIS